ncbi:hypothetical protein SS1G_09046 [Sclerotinia sclerotiorum 1980 UF-70]|uniref:NACHT domain-containing protein n=1 Tax=Sclerotinia sclerotiorum (strain ATCC 18683 / 1980 / Ss-1) TaxID=665079 RepID=A7EUN8_SCLS1|nr:hypothetical protein SS1G_09046 [Sclerotinia sclerotiorum 1980 UF-70]EDN93180.1 hypothetical protein SS1G_09046 [Sclerotinia sclerotiorum 1980 UF-70]
MLDPISTFRLAASILQFVDFASKVITSTAELHHSSSRALANNLELSTIFSDLSAISTDLRARNPHQETRGYSKDELALISLASECEELSDKLLHDLDGLKIKGSHTLWASARQSIRSLWKETYISDMSKRLDSFRSQLLLRLLALLNDRHSAMSAAFMELQHCQGRVETNTGQNLLGLKDDLLAISQDICKHQQNNDRGWNQLSRTIEQGSTLFTERAILKTLRYEGMSRRQSNIIEAHIGTFEWIINPHLTGFIDWLREGGDVYWINGSAGSGKFTLMKYLVGHKVVKNALTDWADTKPLFTGNYYFWGAGNGMEKSQQGLLRSLLYDILGNCPSVLPKLFPDRWVSLNHAGINMDGSWSKAELLDAFNQLTKNQVWPGKFVFFIDGVNEYMGDPSETARLLKAFATSAEVKVIVSSRPWTEIKRFPTPLPGQSLSLQDFTQEHIKHYIRDLITEDPGFSNTQIDERYGNFIDKICDKSGGVFLWVALAVREILKGLTHEDTISELEARLESIPPGLEEFFERILDSIDEFYRPQASQILQMCLAADEPLPLLTFSFLEEEQKNPNYAIAEGINPWTTDHMAKELETLKIRVKARCRDSLQIFETGQWHAGNPGVSFLHRTVEDFFLESRNQTPLPEWINYPYNPHNYVSIVRILLEARADPNWIDYQEPLGRNYGGHRSTLWTAFVRNFFRPDHETPRFTSKSTPTVLRVRREVLELFLKYGADPSATVVYGPPDATESVGHCTVSEYLEKTLPDSAECCNLLLEYKRKNESRNLWDVFPLLPTTQYQINDPMTGISSSILVCS